MAHETKPSSMLKQSNLRKFVRAVSDGLAILMPPGFTIQEVEGQLVLTTAHGEEILLLGHNIESMVHDGLTWPEAVREASHNMLNELQDIVAVTLTVPWPQDPHSDRLAFASPHAEIRKGELIIWFG